MKLRVAAVIVFLALGIGTIGYALLSLLSSNSGWETIEANNGSLGDVSKEFIFQYRLGAADLSPTAEKKALTLLYGKAVRRAYQIFVARDKDADAAGLASLNARPNEEIWVDPGLYTALEVALSGGSRALYLGPLYAQYDSLFCSNTDEEAADCDPEKSEALREEVETLMEYVLDPAMIELKLLGDSRVLLSVSAKYQAYVEENWEVAYLGFGWMTNGFVADYIADELLSAGYANGLLISQEGFVRNLYDGKEEASVEVSRRDGSVVRSAGAFQLQGATTLVYLHDYPLSPLQAGSYYAYEDGTIRAPYVNAKDGMLKNAGHELLLFAQKGEDGKPTRCGELAMLAQSVYIQDELDLKTLEGQKASSVRYLYFDGDQVATNEEGLELKKEEAK
ncbi:MAG: hypothetical protein J5546_05880 [Lachnospiraceae bacterium]|nr:hypothetical protein [Lachnospiraceae bacterium]